MGLGLPPAITSWVGRSGHRVQLTAALCQQVAALSGTVLDIGGGRDSPVTSCWPATARRITIDIQRSLRPALNGDACALPIRSGCADAVLMSEVLEHVAEPGAAIAEVRRVLVPGGRFLGSVPFMGQGVHGDPDDYFRYTASGLGRLLGEFVDVQITAHGNGFGAAWRAVYQGRRWLIPLNPLGRQLSRRTEQRWPEGYTFSATMPR